MGTARHEDQITGWQGDVGGEAGPLGTERVFDHLYHDVLPLAHQFGDVAGLELLLLLDRHALGMGDDVGGVQEGGLVHADVDEGGLHAGQHAADLALVDVAHDAALGLTLHMHFLQQTVLDQGDPGFGGGDVYQQFYRHKLPCLSSFEFWHDEQRVTQQRTADERITGSARGAA